MSVSQGGSGGRCTRSTRQTRLMERALREGWRVRKGMRGTLIDRLGRIRDDAGSGPREVTSAAKAIRSASKINKDSRVPVKADFSSAQGGAVAGPLKDGWFLLGE